MIAERVWGAKLSIERILTGFCVPEEVLSGLGMLCEEAKSRLQLLHY
ncbi:hypothetical protein [Planctomicrobium sp. SH527]